MLGHLFPHGGRLCAFGPLLKRRHVGGRGRHGKTEQIFQYPFAADDWGSALGVRGEGQYTTVSQDPPANLVGNGYPPEVAAKDARYAIVPR